RLRGEDSMTGHSSRHSFAGLPLLLAFFLSACASGASIEEAVPVSANGTPAGPIDTATYPNLNIPPRTAAKQLSKAERDAAVTELTAARQGQPQAAGAAPAANEGTELRTIG